jgi:hypothetical protein
LVAFLFVADINALHYGEQLERLVGEYLKNFVAVGFHDRSAISSSVTKPGSLVLPIFAQGVEVWSFESKPLYFPAPFSLRSRHLRTWITVGVGTAGDPSRTHEERTESY